MTDSQLEISSGTRFAFGANWKSFVGLVDDTRIEAACCSLTAALSVTDLSGRTFLDIGCGSGLFSLAAHRLGASVRSFDFDPDSVAATAGLRRQLAPDSDWTVDQGSILDERYVAQLGSFDVVYSWGVLHHTGNLWRALETAAQLVKPGGTLFISIYNDQEFASRQWRRVKRLYNASGPITRGLLVAGSFVYLHRHRPVNAVIRMRRRSMQRERPVRARGMSAKHDLVDWVGGYPFEVAKPEEVFGLVHPLGFELRQLKTCGGGLGCNEFVFERTG
jgi:2-polyprenyl-3-methyl-5-hydroxy-6-metoxy-1,4-benzoquinol methylase